MELYKLYLIAKKFLVDVEIINIEKITLGNINSTYLVEYLNKKNISKKFILQSINDFFESVELLNVNHKSVTDHMELCLRNKSIYNDHRRWVVPSLIECKSNGLLDFSFEGKSWRAMKFIEASFSISSVKDLKYAYEAGYGLSKFHHFFSNYDSSKLKIAIDDFHDTNYYLEQYYLYFNRFNFNNLNSSLLERINKINRNIQQNSERIINTYNSFKDNTFRKQLIHGDPKLENFLFDESKSVVSLIDLDTIYSGNLLTDLSDCLRSLCNPLGEDAVILDDVSFDMNICRQFLSGYFSTFKQETDSITIFLFDSIYLIIFELAIRFITDFLKSNVYFSVDYPSHNIYRAEVQLKILESFLSQRNEFRSLLYKIV